MRSTIFALFILLAATPSFASQSSSGKPLAGVANFDNTFSRGKPLPKWTQPLAEIPPTQRTDSIVIRMIETQALVGDAPAILFNRAIQVNDQSALGSIGQFGIDYYPIYQKLSLHRLAIMRGGQILDRTATVNVRLLQRESNMESGMYGGATTAQMLLDDVRLGDTLWLTYSVEGENPVFDNHWAKEFNLDSGAPVELRRLTVLHPKQRPLSWRQVGDFRTEQIKPQIDEIGGMTRMRFEQRNIEALESETAIPSDFFVGRIVQMSEYQDWHSVAAWADNLFPKAGNSVALKTLAAQFAKEPTPAARASAALRWVQNEIRYFSVSIGENSHRPQSPDTVIKRRYGDCKDKSYLLVSVLNQLGIEAHPVLLSAEAPKMPAKIIAAPIGFDHAIVQFVLDGHPYYVDPTNSGQSEPLDKIPTAFPGASVLVVDSSSRDLITLPERTDVDPHYEHVENFTIASFDGDATLETHEIYRGSYADWARQNFPRLSANELKKDMLALYEKQYRGITLLDTPSLHDDSVDNRFELRARFNLPKPVIHEEKLYKLEYDSQIIDGTLGIPDKLVRNYPFELPKGKYRSRYRLNIEWPETLRSGDDPVSKTIDNPFFNLHEEYIYRGKSLRYLMDYKIKKDVVNAKDMPELQTQAKRLNEFSKANFHVPDSYLVGPNFIGTPFRDLDATRLAVQIDRALKSFEGVKDSDVDFNKACNMVSDMLKVANVAGKRMADVVNAMEPAMTQNAKRSGTSLCKAREMFLMGEFKKSVDLYQAETPLKDDSIYTRDLAWARFYSGDQVGALADMARFGIARAGLGGDSRNGLDAANEMALYLRTGKPFPPELTRYASELPDGPWPRPLVAMLAGTISPDALIKVIDTYSADARVLALNDAWFYIGQRRLVEKDTGTAAAAFRWYNKNGIRSSDLMFQAKAELKLLEPIDQNFEEGMRAFNNKDYATAIQKFRESADKGMANAQYQLGEAYFTGRGVQTDSEQALHWFHQAAEQGHEGAIVGQALIMSMYFEPARKGNASSQYYLGYAYEYGREVDRNEKIAAGWYEMAALQGHRFAQTHLARLYKEGRGVTADPAKAFTWFQKAADLGVSEAQDEVGAAYYNGKGVALDYGQAIPWFKKAADQGNSDAEDYLGCAYLNGNGVPKDVAIALSWFQKAAELGNKLARTHMGSALNNLGDIYEHGDGVPQDYAHAADLYRQAAATGYATAFINLGSLYQSGKGLSRNPVLAYTYYQIAANTDPENVATKRDSVAKELSNEQMKAADAAASAWKSDMPLPGDSTN